MLKSITRILLALIIVVGTIFIPVDFNQSAKASSSFYYDLLMDQVTSIGVMNKDDFSSYGIVYAKVADFDNNGTDELYIVTLPTSSSEYVERLYEGDQLIYENLIPGPGSGFVEDTSLSIGEGDQGIYLDHSGNYSAGSRGISMGDYHSWHSYSKLENSQVKEILNHSTREFYYDMELIEDAIHNGAADYLELTEEAYTAYEEWDRTSPEYYGTAYYIGDDEVSQDTYDMKVNAYGNVIWEQIIEGDSGSNYSVVDSEGIVNQVLNQLELSSKPENLGDDLKDRLDQELKASLTEWLMYSQWLEEGYNAGTEMTDEELSHYVYMAAGGYGPFVLEDYQLDPAVDSSSFPPNTYTRLAEQDVDQFLSVYLGQSFTEEDFILDDEYFPFVKQEGYYYLPDLHVGSHTLSYIREVYEITKDIYYINFTEYEILGEEFANVPYEMLWQTPASQLFDLITEEERNALFVNSRGYAVMKKSVIDGGYQWSLIERNTTGGTFDDSILDQYEKQKLAPPQIKLDLEDSSNFSTIDDYIEVIQKEVSSKELNEQDKSLLTRFITVALQKVTMQPLEASRNTITLTTEQLGRSIGDMESAEYKFNEVLKLDTLSLPRRVERIYRFNVDRVNVTKPIKLHLDKDMFDGIDFNLHENDSLYFSFDGSSMGTAITFESLQSILDEYPEITLILNYLDDQVELSFEVENSPIARVPSPIQILMPANSETSMAYKDEELWGGQYIKETNSLLFETPGSGTYMIKENEVNLTDIDTLTEEQQQAITYLVTRGFFDVEDNLFEPSRTITRNEFSKTLVRLFFSLDREAKTTFTDVEEASPYYPFIASGQQSEIIYGYNDHTFKGEILISISHVLSLSGRTLANKKGYAYPTNPEDYLNFLDSDLIREEAKGEIALLVREGLIDQGGLLEPNRQITQLEAAEILYKLYMLLYEQPLYMIEADVISAVPFYSEYKWPLAGGGIGIIAIITGMIFVRSRKLKSEPMG
ncbi:hypothetical protein M3689_10975 [Alkalihalophilus marmarensis]|uniref:S-layer homology domain-containing protein n=1 Tax=Alkalihalophilus marmarensis TaxID=521377 RepID=UPI00203B8EA3|nr:S-layer homology domain-containing protein [Alkalihalophilus marmarensis]MCM3489830.1 hypothetical protein [Alkalihalophilus marmarensis]